MCLDVNYKNTNQNNMKKSKESPENSEKTENCYDFPIKCLCGGSLIEHPPVFDPKGEIIYVVWNDKVRLYSIETGECIRDLDDNKDGSIVGLFINPEDKKSLIACTENGTVLTWKLDSNVISNKLKLNLSSTFHITRFVITSIDGEQHGIVSFKDKHNLFKLVLVELKKGKVVQHYQIPFLNEQQEQKVRLADGHADSKFFVAVQKRMIYVVDKTSDKFITHTHTDSIHVVVCHPEEEMFATGDALGKIKLWRNIYDKNPVQAELHWHHIRVLSLAFSLSGTILYSGGPECVLVKWQIKDKIITKDFLPRLPGSIKQISVDPKHDKITLSLDDNAIHVINSNFNQLKSIQDFTQAPPLDLGLSEPFPAGIRMNPRNRQLIMNGRIGHLQFFSTKTMKLLFNVDISMRNVIPRAKKHNIFSTQVTHAVFSMSWMATVESWNDKINSPDSRLKFWRFLEDKQTYSLHTQIEQAHRKEIKALEFSGTKDVNLICATAGLDHTVKIWSLEESENVKNAKMIWMCIEELSYKNLPVRNLGFSQDSSLLAAGFGNVLCVWDTLSFKLKCALSAPAPIDGSTNRVLITLPPKKPSKASQDAVNKALEKRKKIVELMKSVVDGTCGESLVKKMSQEKKERFFKQTPTEKETPKALSTGEKELIFKRVLAIQDLTFNQKIQILHQLHIYYKISNRVEQEVVGYITKRQAECVDLYQNLHRKLNLVKNHEKYKVLWRVRTWNMLTSKRNRKFVTVRKLLNHKIDEKLLEKKKAKEAESEKFLPIKNLAHITNVVFCAEDCSHLVIVTTPDRLLIWNLLTLKIQGSFKLHTKLITLDPLTNLVAVFTKYNDLFIFHPSPAMTIHHQKNMPGIYGAIWSPRDSPKAQTVNVNWQATSQLLFLTRSQEICCLKLPGEEDYGDAAPFMEVSNGFTTNTPFAALIAQKITDETTKDSNGISKRITVSGSGAVKDIINLSSHAMPPMRLLSKDFIGSMLSSQRQEKPQVQESVEPVETMLISDDENDISPEDEKILRRKAIEKEGKVMKEKGAKKKEAVGTIESRMKSLKLDCIKDFEI